MIVMAMLVCACGAIEDGSPPRNPLAETPAASITAPTGVPTAASTAPPAATVPPGFTPPTDVAAELAAGRAIEAMADWLGVPQRELTPRAVEAVEWPDACLGVRQPLVCAQVVTPGYRVRLEDALGAVHTAHVDARSGRVLWAGEVVASVTVTAVDLNGRRVTVQAGGQTLTLRFAPGTTWMPPDAERTAAGKGATVGYDPAPVSTAPGTAAWLAVE